MKISFPTRFTPLLAAILAALACAFVFRDAFAPGYSLLSPDSQLWKYDGWRDLALTNFLGGRYEVPTFDSLLYWLFPLPLSSTLGYLLATALLACAGAHYLRHWKCPAPAAILGGLSLAFSGYHFTLFNAGHRGYFIMTVYAIFLLNAIDGIVESARWPYFVFAGICAVSALRSQPDVFALWCAILAAYALLRIILQGRVAHAAGCARTYFQRLAIGIALFLATTALFGGAAIRYTLTDLVAGREAQLSAAEQETAATDATARWDFATSWSLPPAELPELLCPNLRGYDSGNAKAPYWGSVGRDVHYAETQQGFYNFRQHTLYLGAIPFLLALIALFARNHKQPNDAPNSATPNAPPRAILYFWGTVALLALLLALGRYTPLYRAFYALPMMSSIRGPLKFLHFTEAAVALLAGFGCARLMRPNAASRATIAVAILGFFITSALLFAAFSSSTPAIQQALTALGVPAQNQSPLLNALSSQRQQTLLLTAALFSLSSIALLWIGLSKRALPRWLAPTLALLSLLDMVRAAAPYANPVDTRTYALPNALVESLRKSGQLEASTWGGSALGLESYFPFIQSFEHHYLLQADPQRTQDPSRPSILVAQNLRSPDPMRRWQLLGTRIVILPIADYQRISTSSSVYIPLGTYAFTRNGIISLPDPNQAQFGAVALRDWTPNASVFTHWNIAESPEDAWRILSDRSLDLKSSLVITGNPPISSGPRPASSAHPTQATCLVGEKAGHYRHLAFETPDTSPAGLLYIRNLFNGFPEVTASVDGSPTPIYTANALFRAVHVPAGKHTIEFHVPLHPSVALAYAASLLLLIAATFALYRKPQKTHTTDEITSQHP